MQGSALLALRPWRERDEGTGVIIREIVKNEKLPEGEGFDADYFFQTQDPLPDLPKDEPRWVKSMSGSDVRIKGTTATAIVTFLDGYPKVRVTLITEGNVWKIDRVKNVR